MAFRACGPQPRLGRMSRCRPTACRTSSQGPQADGRAIESEICGSLSDSGSPSKRSHDDRQGSPCGGGPRRARPCASHARSGVCPRAADRMSAAISATPAVAPTPTYSPPSMLSSFKSTWSRSLVRDRTASRRSLCIALLGRGVANGKLSVVNARSIDPAASRKSSRS